MRRLLHISLVTAVVLACTVPAALAQELPDAIDDPAPALQPQPADPAPMEEDVVVEVEPDGAAAVEDAAGPGVAAQSRPPANANAYDPGTVVPVTGSLPFTGADPGQLVQALLVGLVLISGGVTAIVWSRAAAAPR